MSQAKFIPLQHEIYEEEEMQNRARAFYEEMRRRRTVRHFSDRPVSLDIIKHCLQAAGTAPSGANMQPWHFVIVTDPEIKRRIRQAAEKEERAFYEHLASAEWLEALAPLGTTPEKPFLETAPCLIAVFAESFGLQSDGTRVKHYYVNESVGIATGMLITALHHAGLATLTHTPSPMGFLKRILKRPPNERPYLLLVTGYPAEGALVPVIGKKSLEQIATFI
jgi:nitroreductase